jgi:DNA-binding NarL/FixJ family response regulator
VRIVIAEDSVLLLDGLARLLRAEGHGVATFRTAEEMVAALTRSADMLPDLLVTDVRMPPSHTDEGLRAAGTRGLGYVLKDRVADVDEFLGAVERVASGGTVLDPEVVSQVLARSRSDLGDLTRREREVLALIAEGLSNAAIAERLVVGLPAVEKHVTNILTKLGLPPDADTHRRVLAVLRWLDLNGDLR